jgi:hypothetical protein
MLRNAIRTTVTPRANHCAIKPNAMESEIIVFRATISKDTDAVLITPEPIARK